MDEGRGTKKGKRKEERDQKSDFGGQRSDGSNSSNHQYSIFSRQSKSFFREDGVKKFQGLFQRSLDINPRKWKKAVDRVCKYFPDHAVVLGIVPEHNQELKRLVMGRIEDRESEKIRG